MGSMGQTVCASTAPGTCAGATCDAGQACCLTTGTCFDTASAARDCPAQGTTFPGGKACASNSDCGGDEFCMADAYDRCLGAGHCQPISNCGGCVGGDVCRVCGCNGLTYASIQEACVAGARVAARAPCGGATRAGDGFHLPVVACGTDAHCPTGSRCCALNGRCYEPTEPWRCQLQPDGAIFNCASASECSGGFGGGPGETRCAGEGCSAPGVCTSRTSTSSCGGDVQQVCGCDGVTYVNACWAGAAGARVASQGACP